MSTDWDWEQFGEKDPYWAVITLDKYRAENMSAETMNEFYASGEYQVNWMFDLIRERVDPNFAPASALDFGCGVGRLAVALAQRCERALGVDVSAGMLRKAQDRCDQAGIKNLSLIKGNDDLSTVEGKFDFVTTFIVLQHIPVSRGEVLFRRLLDLVKEGGVGALHITYSRVGVGPDPVRDNNFVVRPERDPDAPPQMEMNAYDLNRLFHWMQEEAGIRRFHVEFTNHGGTYGIMVFFRKTSDGTYET